jgi:hypothetical protein
VVTNQIQASPQNAPFEDIKYPLLGKVEQNISYIWEKWRKTNLISGAKLLSIRIYYGKR